MTSEGPLPDPQPDRQPQQDDNIDSESAFHDLDLDVGPNTEKQRFDRAVQESVAYWHHREADGASRLPTRKPEPDDELWALKGSLWTKLIHGDEILNMPPQRSLVGGLLHLNSLAAVYGPPASGKSLLVQDIALSIASRNPWQGRDVVDGPVLYVIAEDVPGMGARSRAWRARHGQLGDIHWLLQRVPLLESDTVSELCDVVARVAPALIVLDTLARCMIGADENSSREMGLAVDALARLQAVTNSCVCVVHHGGKDASRGLRGSNVLLAAADTTIECKATRSGMTAVVEKQKNGPIGQRMHFGFDAEGESVVLVEGSPTSPTVATFRPTVLMERVSVYLEATPNANLRAVRTAITSKSGYVDGAVKCLVDEGYITTSTGARNATLHTSVKPYRDDSNDAA